ncbi:hypothetical protein ABZT02_34120 [Streptomyces sp. NPDC005402]|uniref:5'-methylthioadenosine/S-adenosylhomocysteine nucleosidase family protein n=1 Tax=Streptomyces sp. NPDC005402 TaxID=3155338 RepID=UPI0033B310CD
MPKTDGRYAHARVAILTAIAEETWAVRERCNLGRHLKYDFYAAPDADPDFPDVIHCQVGRGNLMVGDPTKDLIERMQPELIVFCGIAGGINGREGISVGDLVVPPYIHYCSFAKLSKHGRQTRFVPYDHPSIRLHKYHAAHLGYDWKERNRKNPVGGKQFRGSKVLTDSSIVAGDKVYGDPTSEEQRWVVKTFDDAVAIDMESAGVCTAVAASRDNPSYNPRLLVVRCISDMINSKGNNTERKVNKEATAEIASAFVHELVNEFLEDEPDTRLR